MARKRESRVKVWTSISQDTFLKYEILARTSGFPLFHHFRKALEDYVRDVRPDGSRTPAEIGGER